MCAVSACVYVETISPHLIVTHYNLSVISRKISRTHLRFVVIIRIAVIFDHLPNVGRDVELNPVPERLFSKYAHCRLHITLTESIEVQKLPICTPYTL